MDVKNVVQIEGGTDIGPESVAFDIKFRSWAVAKVLLNITASSDSRKFPLLEGSSDCGTREP
jgi:hypothetical protein